MRVLTIDIGNTAVKGSVFEKGELLDSVLLETRVAAGLAELAAMYKPGGAICCCVGQDADEFIKDCGRLLGMNVESLTHDTPLPIRVEYATPRTLGLDRIAAAAGAALVADNALVVDAGTAITLDIVSDNTFLGGNISPGLRLRFHSLNRFTSCLPLVSPAGDVPAFGYDTQTAIRSGVVNGIVAEIKSAYESASSRYPGLRLLLAGGDAGYLSPLLEMKGLRPERASGLVGRGLERIFLFNR